MSDARELADKLAKAEAWIAVVEAEAGKLDTLACSYAHEAARLREALVGVADILRLSGAFQEDALLSSADPQ